MVATNNNGNSSDFESITSTETTTRSTFANRPNACIVGGGLGGLATAAALRKLCGMETTILEYASEEEFWSSSSSSQASDVDVGPGAAIQLGPNGLSALQAIGGDDLLQRIYEESTVLKQHAIALPHLPTPIIMPDTTQPETGMPLIMIRWSRLRELLRDLVPADSIHTNVRDVVGYQVHQEKETTMVQAVGDGDGNSDLLNTYTKSSLLIGADGIQSTFAALLALQQKQQQQQQQESVYSSDDDSETASQGSNPVLSPSTSFATTTDEEEEAAPPADSATSAVVVLPRGREQEARRMGIKDGGRLNIKAVVPVELADLKSGDFVPHTTYSYFCAGGEAACFAGPAGPGYTYWAISLPDDAATGVPYLADLQGDWSNKNKAEIQQRLLDTLTSLNNDDKNKGQLQFVLDLISQTIPKALHVMRSQERDLVGHLTSLCCATAESSSSSSAVASPVVLVGDAAHAMSGAYGQAANFAFEDAITLAACLKKQLQQQQQHNDKNDVAIAAALQDYSDARLDRCREMQCRSAERAANAGKNNNNKGSTIQEISKWLYQWTADSVWKIQSSNSNNNNHMTTSKKKKTTASTNSNNAASVMASRQP